MATYHLSAKIGSKGKGCAHSDYIERKGKNAKHKDLEHVENGNLPSWANGQSSTFWKAADEFERANGSVYREIEIALPRELTPGQRLELVREFIGQEIGEKHAYSFAIHCPKAALDPGKGEQPHAHIMYSERKQDGIDRTKEQYFKRYNAKNPEKGGLKKDIPKDMVEKKQQLRDLRESWANLQNSHLKKHGHESKVDHRTLEAQGIQRDPRKHLPHLGVAAISIAKKQQPSTRINMLNVRRQIMIRSEQDKALTIKLAQEREIKKAKLAAEVQQKAAEAIKRAEAMKALSEMEKSFTERLRASMEAFVNWIKEQGGKKREFDTNSSLQWNGKIEKIDNLHAVQHIGRREYVIHELDKLEKVPKLHDSVVIKYREGRGLVTSNEKSQGRGLSR